MHTEEKKQSSEITSEMTQMIELVDRAIKTVFITVFHMVQELEETLNMLSRNMEDINW